MYFTGDDGYQSFLVISLLHNSVTLDNNNNNNNNNNDNNNNKVTYWISTKFLIHT